MTDEIFEAMEKKIFAMQGETELFLIETHRKQFLNQFSVWKQKQFSNPHGMPQGK